MSGSTRTTLIIATRGRSTWKRSGRWSTGILLLATCPDKRLHADKKNPGLIPGFFLCRRKKAAPGAAFRERAGLHHAAHATHSTHAAHIRGATAFLLFR